MLVRTAAIVVVELLVFINMLSIPGSRFFQRARHIHTCIHTYTHGTKVDLCEEQRYVLRLVLRGKSVFFTGAAGTGKSFLLKKLHKVPEPCVATVVPFLC